VLYNNPGKLALLKQDVLAYIFWNFGVLQVPSTGPKVWAGTFPGDVTITTNQSSSTTINFNIALIFNPAITTLNAFTIYNNISSSTFPPWFLRQYNILTATFTGTSPPVNNAPPSPPAPPNPPPFPPGGLPTNEEYDVGSFCTCT
jgi:hypothetical protein